MKKVISFILAMILCLSVCACEKEQEKTDRESSGSEGVYFIEKMIIYNANGEEEARMTVEFNNQGLPEKANCAYDYDYIKLNYDNTGSLLQCSTIVDDEPCDIFEFDKNGFIVHEQCSGLRYEYEVDDEGNVLERVKYMDDNVHTEKSYEYDEHGNKTFFMTKYLFNEWDTIYAYKYEHSYDSNGNLIKTLEYTQSQEFWNSEQNAELSDAAWEHTLTEEYEYENGKLTAIRYASGGYSKFEYDQNGNCTKFSDYSDDGELGFYCTISYRMNPVKLTQQQINAYNEIAEYTGTMLIFKLEKLFG